MIDTNRDQVKYSSDHAQIKSSIIVINENTLNMGYIITSILSVLRFQASNSHKGPINSGQTVTSIVGKKATK